MPYAEIDLNGEIRELELRNMQDHEESSELIQRIIELE